MTEFPSSGLLESPGRIFSDNPPVHPPATQSGKLPDSKESSSLAKKHKCPYCQSEFVRHHNLKTHLLTHSQEKPYSCQTCQQRFRRLHDLKRHAKLHKIDKSYTCSNCNRNFASRDVLAQHGGGTQGCGVRQTGLESSFGVYTHEDTNTWGKYANSGMDGIEYTEVSVPQTRNEDVRQEKDLMKPRVPPLQRPPLESRQTEDDLATASMILLSLLSIRSILEALGPDDALGVIITSLLRSLEVSLCLLDGLLDMWEPDTGQSGRLEFGNGTSCDGWVTSSLSDVRLYRLKRPLEGLRQDGGVAIRRWLYTLGNDVDFLISQFSSIFPLIRSVPIIFFIYKFLTIVIARLQMMALGTMGSWRCFEKLS